MFGGAKTITALVGFFLAIICLLGIGAWAAWAAKAKVGACQNACSDALCSDNGTCKDSKTQVGLISGSAFALAIILAIFTVIVMVME